MAKYACLLQRTASTTLSVGVINAAAASPRRFQIYRLEFGSEASPADNAFLWQLQRATTTGTSTSVTPQAINPADAAATTVAGTNTTVDPTLTANAMLLTVPLNQRATYQWQPAPGGELIAPATANNGIAIRTPTSSAVAITCTAYIEEL